MNCAHNRRPGLPCAVDLCPAGSHGEYLIVPIFPRNGGKMRTIILQRHALRFPGGEWDFFWVQKGFQFPEFG